MVRMLPSVKTVVDFELGGLDADEQSGVAFLVLLGFDVE